MMEKMMKKREALAYIGALRETGLYVRVAATDDYLVPITKKDALQLVTEYGDSEFTFEFHEEDTQRDWVLIEVWV